MEVPCWASFFINHLRRYSMNSLVPRSNNSISIFDHFDELSELMFRDMFNHDSFFTSVLNHPTIDYPTNIVETDTGVALEIAAIGIDRKDVKIEVKDNEITISYAKSEETKSDDKKKGYIHRGITNRSFSHNWHIGDDFDKSKIDAKLEKGMLTITIPYSEKKKEDIKIIDVK